MTTTGQMRRRRGGTTQPIAPSESADAGAATDPVAIRAFELFLARGGAHGHDLDDWFTAERQLRTAPTRKKGAPKSAVQA